MVGRERGWVQKVGRQRGFRGVIGGDRVGREGGLRGWVEGWVNRGH